MKTVNIYIETTIKSPIVKDGKYASALVFTRSNGEEAYRVMSGEECESTYNRLTLIAIIIITKIKRAVSCCNSH